MKNYLANKMNAVREGMKDNKGFSLVELIIVVAIMGVLMGILAPQYLRFIESSREQTDVTAANELQKAMTIAISTIEGDHTLEAFTWSYASGASTMVWGNANQTAFGDEVQTTIGTMPDQSSNFAQGTPLTLEIGINPTTNTNYVFCADTDWADKLGLPTS